MPSLYTRAHELLLGRGRHEVSPGEEELRQTAAVVSEPLQGLIKLKTLAQVLEDRR